MGIKFYDSNGKYWGEYDETRSLFIPSEETITQTETQNSNLNFEKRTMRDCYNCKRYENDCECRECNYEPKDEPQTYVINPQEPTNDDKCFECDDFFICGGQCNKIEDEPQTERSE